MALQVTIAGIDRTRDLRSDSLVIKNILTKKKDECEFEILVHSGGGFLPNMGNEVIVSLDGTTLFGGVITEIASKPSAFNSITHKINCQDYSRILDSKLVPDTYENQTVNEIITDLKNRYFPNGFTINNVDADIKIDYIGFKYRSVTKCLEKLANIINYDWYVDQDKDLHFFSKEGETAPFSLTDTNGKYTYDSLVIRKDNTQLRNNIIVRGGSYLGNTFTAEIEANGVDFVFPLPYKFSDFKASLTGNPLSVGTDFIDNADDFDALHGFQEKILRFKEADKPSSGAVATVSGRPNLPVIVRFQASEYIQDTLSAEGIGDGKYEYLIEDKSIKTKAGARQRAMAEVLAYAQTLSEGEFVTESAGLRAGQKIAIQSDTRGVDEEFMINKVVARQFGPNTLKYEVSFITTRTFDLIDILQRLLLEGTDKIEIDENETVDLVFQFSDTMSMTDSLGTPTTDSPPYYWEDASLTTSNPGNWGYATWS